ncbi:MAG: hypothetical protein K0M56_03875 [Kaistella sp.]|nr:hypothetical protein [Kaistella sp.]
MDEKEKSYLVKIPVFVTEIIENAEDLFGGLSLIEMRDFIEKKANAFIEAKPSIFFENRNKSKRTVIEGLRLTEHFFGSTPGFLIKISAYTTNLLDGYFQATEKIIFERDNKIGSDNNYIFIYPQIKGLEKNKYQYYFIVLIYEDPHKLNDELIKITKLTLKKIFDTPIRNIKMPTLLEELRSFKRAQEFQIRFTSVYFDDNDIDLKYREFLTEGKVKKQKMEKFENIPTQFVEEIILSEDFGGYDKMESKITQGKKEYRISKEHIKEARDLLDDYAEKVFNASATITKDELEKIYDESFMISKILPVLENYLSSGDE